LTNVKVAADVWEPYVLIDCRDWTRVLTAEVDARYQQWVMVESKVWERVAGRVRTDDVPMKRLMHLWLMEWLRGRGEMDLLRGERDVVVVALAPFLLPCLANRKPNLVTLLCASCASVFSTLSALALTRRGRAD
jgi:hypothetical protein